MRRIFTLLLACVLAFSGTVAQALPVVCQTPPTERVMHSVVELTVAYDEPTAADSVGHRGSGVFVTPTTIATVEHVAEGIDGAVTIGWSDEFDVDTEYHFELPVVDITYIDTGLAERIALIELPARIEGRQVVGVRYAPLLDTAPVFGVGFRGGVMRYADGRHLFPEASSTLTEGERDAPPLFFEMADWVNNDRMVFDYGSSGAPIFDCEGRVVALIMQVVTQEIQLGGFAAVLEGLDLTKRGTMRVSTAWGQYNVLAAPASVLVVEE